MSDNVSESFMKAFDSRTSGCSRTCSCGRTHFDVYPGNSWTWEDGELERLERNAKEHPDKYVPSDGAVGSYEVDGVEFVWGCECNGGAKYERFILRHAEQIAKFFNARAADLRAQAGAMMIKEEA